MIEGLLILGAFVLGLVGGAKWQQNVFAAEKLAAEETAKLVEAAKKRINKKKTPPPAA